MALSRPRIAHVAKYLLAFGVLSTLSASLLFAKDVMPWQYELAPAIKQARSEGKLLLLHFYTPTCGPCRQLEKNVYSIPAVGEALSQNYVMVKVNADDSLELVDRFEVDRWPTDVVVTTAGKKLDARVCEQDPKVYVERLAKIASEHAPRAKSQVAASDNMKGPQAPSLASEPSGKDHPIANPDAAQAITASPSAKDAASVLPPGAPPLALEGYDVVEILSPDRRWTEGDVRFGVIHQGRTYLFKDMKNQRYFFENANHLAPAAGGDDAVMAVDFARVMPGKPEFPLIYGGRLFLFSSQRSLDRFYEAPEKYLEENILASRARSGKNLLR